jgi:hypothetical protein
MEFLLVSRVRERSDPRGFETAALVGGAPKEATTRFELVYEALQASA